MNPQVQKYLAKKYETDFTSFYTSSDLVGKYKTGDIDMAIPSSLVIEDLAINNVIDKID
jgi:hypothetical protein